LYNDVVGVVNITKVDIYAGRQEGKDVYTKEQPGIIEPRNPFDFITFLYPAIKEF